MKTGNTLSYKEQEGFIFLWIIAIVGVSALFLHMGMESLCATMKASEFLEEQEARDHFDSIAQTILWEHCIHEVKGPCIFNTDTNRLTQKLSWALPPEITLLNVKLLPISQKPFEKTKKATESDYASLNPAHPLGKTFGSILHQEVSFQFSLERTGKEYHSTFKMVLKQISSSEMGLILPFELSCDHLQISLSIHGYTLTSAYTLPSGKRKHAFESIIASFVSRACRRIA